MEAFISNKVKVANVSDDIILRQPTADDCAAVFELIEQCPPLGKNSRYCNLLQCSHFATTSVSAEYKGDIVGFISGYLIPNRPDTLFVCQVAVAKYARAQGGGGSNAPPYIAT